MEGDEEEVGLNNIVHEDTTTVSASSAMIVESFSRNAASMDQQQYMHAENHHHHHYHSSDTNLWIDMIDELIDLPSAHAFFDPSSNFPSLDLPPPNSPSGSLCNTLHPFFSPSFDNDDNDTDNHPSSSLHHHHHNLPPLPNSSSSTSPHPQHMIHNPYSQQPPAPNLPSGRIHKVVSAPQLHHLDPYRQSPTLQSSMPQFPFHQQSERLMSTPPEFSRLAAGYNLSSTQKSPMNMGRFDSRPVPRYDPHKLSGLPHSLPSASYLSDHRPGDPIVHPFHEAASVYSSQSTTSAAQLHDIQDSGLQLVHLLLACAEAVAREDFITVKTSLLQLQQLVSTSGDSMQRVAAYFTDALHSRVTGTGRRSYMALRSYDPATADEVLGAYQILYQACPYVKFAHFISNQAIFEAFEGEDRVHIVDLDIIQGYQWPAFIQALASRPGGAPHLRITGVGMPLSAIEETGKRLKELAESLHVPFEFHAVGERLENLKAYMLHRKVGEALAVNSVNRLHRLLSETTNLLAGILHMIREQAPNIFTLVEQEASHNGPFFLSRFLEALHYYSAIFDSLEATLPRASPERTKVEQLVFAPEITNIVACEGNERLERHEKLGKWRKMMESIGFQSVPLGANAVNQSKLLLGLYPCDGYTLIEDKGCLQLGWQDRPIVGASAWRC